MRLFLFFLSAKTALAQSCYLQNGTALPSLATYNEYKPCTSGPSTVCCGVNRSNPTAGDPANGNTIDECLPNGLCQNRVTKNGVETTTWFSDFCADSSWNSSSCLDICDQTRSAFGITAVTPCTGRADSDRWCCGTNNACCASNVGVVHLAQVLGGVLWSSTASSAMKTSTPAPSVLPSLVSETLSSVPSSSSSVQSQGVTKSGLSGGATAGVVIGAVAGLALIGTIIFFAMRSARSRKSPYAAKAVNAPAQNHRGTYHEKSGEESPARSELPTMPTELPSQNTPTGSLHPHPEQQRGNGM